MTIKGNLSRILKRYELFVVYSHSSTRVETERQQKKTVWIYFVLYMAVIARPVIRRGPRCIYFWRDGNKRSVRVQYPRYYYAVPSFSAAYLYVRYSYQVFLLDEGGRVCTHPPSRTTPNNRTAESCRSCFKKLVLTVL